MTITDGCWWLFSDGARRSAASYDVLGNQLALPPTDPQKLLALQRTFWEIRLANLVDAFEDRKQNADNSFDYDLCNGRVPPSQDAHAVHGEPIYAAGAGFDPANRTGRFQLALDSPGVGAGQPIPNFSRGYTGEAPDLGAHQRGAPPIQYGVRANQP